MLFNCLVSYFENVYVMYIITYKNIYNYMYTYMRLRIYLWMCFIM